MQNKSKFTDKKVFIIATMGLFSGDGTGCSARLLVECGAEIVGGIHLTMPDCIGDEKLLKKMYHVLSVYKQLSSTSNYPVREKGI